MLLGFCFLDLFLKTFSAELQGRLEKSFSKIDKKLSIIRPYFIYYCSRFSCFKKMSFTFWSEIMQLINPSLCYVSPNLCMYHFSCIINIETLV